jgi:hypothetical protein
MLQRFASARSRSNVHPEWPLGSYCLDVIATLSPMGTARENRRIDS